MSTDTPDTSRVVEATPEYESGFAGISPVNICKKGRFSLVREITWNGEENPFKNYSVFWHSETGLFYIIPHALLRQGYSHENLTGLNIFKVGDPTRDQNGRIKITKRNEMLHMEHGKKFLGGMGAYMVLAPDQKSITEMRNNRLANAAIRILLHPEIAQQVIQERETTDIPEQNQRIEQAIAETQSLISALIHMRLSQGRSVDKTVDIGIRMPCGDGKTFNLRINITPPETAWGKSIGEKEAADSEIIIGSIARLINGFVNTVLHQTHPQDANTQINFADYDTEVSVIFSNDAQLPVTARREKRLRTKAQSGAPAPNTQVQT